MSDREKILTDEFVRPETPGLRPFSVGILTLARALGLSIAGTDKRELSAEESAREIVILAWLLDERNSREEIKLAAQQGRARFEAERLDDYQFAIEPAWLVAVQLEYQRTNAAVEATLFRIAPKPSTGAPAPEPPGKS